MRREAGFGQGCNGKIDGRWVLAGCKTRSSNAHFVDDESFYRGQRLCDALDAGAAVHSIDSQREFRHPILPFHFDDTPGEKARYLRIGLEFWRIMQREFPMTPLMCVGAVIVEAGRVLLVRRGNEPMKGHWTLPGGLLELGEPLIEGVKREAREETGLTVEPVQLIELVDRIHRQKEGQAERVRYHYVIADYLCRVVGGVLQAASDADAVRWVEREEWNRPDTALGALKLDPITARVIETGWQRAQELEER
jgi:ADP-ribose pyrophosphatase YjhB (NUDIX family)